MWGNNTSTKALHFLKAHLCMDGPMDNHSVKNRATERICVKSRAIPHSEVALNQLEKPAVGRNMRQEKGQTDCQITYFLLSVEYITRRLIVLPGQMTDTFRAFCSRSFPSPFFPLCYAKSLVQQNKDRSSLLFAGFSLHSSNLVVKASIMFLISSAFF